jgi:hypothetical protein
MALVCFYCHRSGHIKNNCQQWKQSSRRLDNPEHDRRLCLDTKQVSHPGETEFWTASCLYTSSEPIICAIGLRGGTFVVAVQLFPPMQEAKPKLRLEFSDAVCVTAAGKKLNIT